MTLRSSLHRGMDQLAMHAMRLRPMHPPRLMVGPIRGDPELPAGGIPIAAGLDIPDIRRRRHLVLPSPVRGVLPPNDRLHLDIFPPASGKPPRGLLLISPFWQVPAVATLASYVGVGRSLGMSSVVYTLPDHMRRTPKGYFSGERLLSWDLPHMAEMLRLGAAELVSISHALRQHNLPVFLMGLSLGGLFAAMAALAHAPLDGLMLLTPAADLQVSMSRSLLGRRYRHLLQRRGDHVPDADWLSQVGFPYRARSFPRPLDGQRIFLAHGRHDAVVPHSVAVALSHRWQVPLRTYRRGHMSLIFMEPRLRRDLKAFLRSLLEQPGREA